MKINTKITIKPPHITASLNLVLSVVLVAVALFELYLAYSYLYKDLVTSPVVLDNDKIVRVDNKSYSTVIKLLDERKNFNPANPTPANTNPFK